MTHRELIARYLDHDGHVCLSRTPRRWTYARAQGGYYYLGASGSWRFGRNVTTSLPVNANRKAYALAWANAPAANVADLLD